MDLKKRIINDLCVDYLWDRGNENIRLRYMKCLFWRWFLRMKSLDVLINEYWKNYYDLMEGENVRYKN